MKFNVVLAGLQKVAVRVNREMSKTKAKKTLVRDCVQYFTQCHKHVLDLASASSLVDVVKGLVHHVDYDSDLTNNIGERISCSCGVSMLLIGKVKCYCNSLMMYQMLGLRWNIRDLHFGIKRVV